MEGGDQSCGLLVEDIPNLTIKFSQLVMLASLKLSPTAGPFLHARLLRGEAGFQFVLILPFGPKLPPVVNQRPLVLTQDSRRTSFHLFDQPVDAKLRVHLHEQMHMVRHDLHFDDFRKAFSRYGKVSNREQKIWPPYPEG